MANFGAVVGGIEAAKRAESKLDCGLNSLGSQAQRAAEVAGRLTQIAGRLAGFEPESKGPPSTASAAVRPVETHLDRFSRIYTDLGEALDRIERQAARLEETVG